MKQRRMRPVDPVRRGAMEVLARWIQEHHHVESILLDHERRLRTEPTVVERRRLRELVFGCVRLRGRYDFLVDTLREAGGRAPKPRVRALLWIALHEIFETHTPVHSAVDEAVRLAHGTKMGWAAGYVNAVLREVTRHDASHWFGAPEDDPLAWASTWLSHPRWLVERWRDLLGDEEMIALCEANNRRPLLHLRAAPGRRDSLERSLSTFGWKTRAHALAPDALVLEERVPPALILDQVEEACAVQDAAAQLVAPLAADDGVRWALDLCAAPGGKGLHLAQCLGPDARVVATDLAPERLARMLPTIDRLGCRGRVLGVVSDGTRAAFGADSFDTVLVDAPCSGTGVLSRRHDARWLRTVEDIPRLAELQGRLLDAALDLARPGGTVVYATCSLEVEENDEVVDSVLARREDAEEIGVAESVPAEVVEGARLAVWPHRHDADGAFAARLRKKGSVQ